MAPANINSNIQAEATTVSLRKLRRVTGRLSFAVKDIVTFGFFPFFALIAFNGSNVSEIADNTIHLIRRQLFTEGLGHNSGRTGSGGAGRRNEVVGP
jgi:hypothetical protein